jgi:hypothetical protein
MKKTLIALTILASALSGAQAGIVLNDTFDYNPSGTTPVSIVGAPGSAWRYNSGTAGSMQVYSNSLVVSTARTEDIYRPWQSGPSAYMSNSAAVLYSSYTLHCIGLPTLAGTYFSHFGGTNCYTSSAATITGHRCRVFSSVTNFAGGGAGQGQWYLSVLNTSITGVTTNTVWPTALDTNTTYTVVTRYVVATGESTLWVDPSAESSTSVTNANPLPWDWTAGYLGEYFPMNGPINIGFYNFRQATGEGTMVIDNLKVGTRFSDVAGANTSPTINVPVNQNTPMGIAVGPLAFTVQDTETPAYDLNVNATSSNTGLVPNGNISLASDPGGTNRTITITPVAGQQGFTTITLVVDDSVNYTTNSFLLTVGAPTIGAIPNQITAINTATPLISFFANDQELDPLTFTKASSNPTLVTPAGIVVTGSSPNWAVQVTPQSGQSGVSTITLGVTDGYNTNYTSFKVTVPPASVGLIYNEDFAYTSFDIPNALYGASGGSGAPWGHVSGTGYELQVTNGWAYIVGTNGEDVGAPFISSATYDGSLGYVFYTSFTVDFSYLPSNAGEYFFHLSASAADTSNFRDKIFANKANAATGKFRLAVANVANSPVQFTRDLMLGATYAVVTRYNAATGDTVLWVNPVNEQNPGAAASDTPGSSTIGGVALRQAGCCTGDLAIGPMKVGTSFFDVWTAPAQPPLNWMVDNSGNLVLSWNAPLFVLQSAPDAAGPYTDLTPTSPYTNSISGQQYFRLRY